MKWLVLPARAKNLSCVLSTHIGWLTLPVMSILEGPMPLSGVPVLPCTYHTQTNMQIISKNL